MAGNSPMVLFFTPISLLPIKSQENQSPRLDLIASI